MCVCTIFACVGFAAQILNGRSWVIVDGAILDISTFTKRHPGGTRLIVNAMGTGVTSEIMGEEASIGNSNMAFTPHVHTEVRCSYRTQAPLAMLYQIPTGMGEGEASYCVILGVRNTQTNGTTTTVVHSYIFHLALNPGTLFAPVCVNVKVSLMVDEH